MKRKLRQEMVNGKLVWRLADGAAPIKAPCERLRRARAAAKMVHEEIEKEKLQEKETASMS